jgi:hypothetical protein
MKLFQLLVLALLSMSPALCAAQCHHFSSHSHVSHSHVSHSHAYHSHHCSRSRGSSGRSQQVVISDPMKGQQEVTGNIGVASDLQVTDESVKTAGPVYFGSYKYFVTNKLALSISVGTQALSGRDTCNCAAFPPGSSLALYNFNANALTITTGLTWVYYSKGLLEAYGGAEAGVSILKENDRYSDNTVSSVNAYKFNTQVTLAGLRYGRALGAVVELGFGYRGLLSAGLSYQAGWKKAHNAF